jgi:uncharacterized protein YkwD
MKPVAPFTWNSELYFVCRDHINDIGTSGIYGNYSSGGLNIYDRLKSYTQLIPGMLAENVSYGTVLPIEAIILMLVDDGDRD